MTTFQMYMTLKNTSLVIKTGPKETISDNNIGIRVTYLICLDAGEATDQTQPTKEGNNIVYVGVDVLLRNNLHCIQTLRLNYFLLNHTINAQFNW